MDLVTLAWPRVTELIEEDQKKARFPDTFAPTSLYQATANVAQTQQDVKQVQKIEAPLTDVKEKEQLTLDSPPQVVEQQQQEQLEREERTLPPKRQKKAPKSTTLF